LYSIIEYYERKLHAMPIETIDVYDLKHISYLSAAKCEDFSEAAAVCLDYHQHSQEVLLSLNIGTKHKQFKLIWKEVTQKIRDSRNDMDYTVESGAYCLAMLVIQRLTDYMVIKQSKKGTGFDYWIGKTPIDTSFQEEARLEVSGILKGTKGRINQRLKEKVAQTNKSDNMGLPAFIVVVEFSNPTIKIIQK